MDLTRMLQGANGDIIVLSMTEGAWLGVLSAARFDPATKGIVAVLFRRNGARCMVPAEAMQVFGNDAFLVRSRADARELVEDEPLPGRDLRMLHDVPLTTQRGERLGLVSDVRIDREDGKLTTVLFDDGRALEVNPEEITVGRDEILVPAEYTSRVREARAAEVGLFERMSAGSPLGEVVTGVRRMVAKSARNRASTTLASSGH